ncbi:unnamed protein product [Urochloa decumbens]|uniref:BURP domain-containing protein n=1 Tax=Urochloa decumbens TaxID=240449 RepID=A0ABC8WAF6_9POAL
MHPSTLLLIMVAACTAAARGDPDDTTPAARFWEQALPGTQMPKAIADLVQKGIDHSPLVEHYPAFPDLSVCGAWSNTCTRSMALGTGIFFHKAQLRQGSAMEVSFPPTTETAILPHSVAADEKKAPFANLTEVLATFAIAPGSAEAEHVRDTLKWCHAPPQIAGELMSCATSLETTVESATRMLLGTNTSGEVWAAASALPSGGGLPRGRYVVEAVAPLDGDHFVACHKVPFPYAVYQCHMTTRMTDRAYVVSLRSGALTADMVAFCHLDTSNWNQSHPAFEILHTKLGMPVCHFVPYGNPVFGKKATKA